MSQVQISLDAESVELLDETAAASGFSREEALKAAIEQYSAYDRWFRSKVEEGLKDLAEGRIIPNEEVEAEAEALIASILAKSPDNK